MRTTPQTTNRRRQDPADSRRLPRRTRRPGDAPARPSRPGTATTGATLDEGYWARRIRSASFKRDLTALLAQRMQALSREKVKDVVNPRVVRRIIQESATRMNHEAVAEVVIQATAFVQRRLKAQNASLLGLLDENMVEAIDAVLDEDVVLSRHAEDFIKRTMQQEFVRSLFTDIIYTSIVSFNKQVNPFFGGITMMVLEEQIRGFIRLFMPMIQKQAAAFAVRSKNQAVFLQFGRSIFRQLLDEPLPHLFALASSKQAKQAEALIKESLGNSKLRSALRRATLDAWDELYGTIRNRKVGDVLRLDGHTQWLAERGVALILPLLSRPAGLRFIAAEMARAAAAPQ